MDIRIVVVAVALAFGAGFYTKGKFDTAAVVEQVEKDAKQSATNVVQAEQQSATLDTAIDKDGDRIDAIKEAAAARVAKYQPKPESKNADGNTRSSNGAVAPGNDHTEAAGISVAEVGNPGDCGMLLDIGTVRLLNSARQGSNVGAAGSSDGEKPAAADAAR